MFLILPFINCSTCFIVLAVLLLREVTMATIDDIHVPIFLWVCTTWGLFQELKSQKKIMVYHFHTPQYYMYYHYQQSILGMLPCLKWPEMSESLQVHCTMYNWSKHWCYCVWVRLKIYVYIVHALYCSPDYLARVILHVSRHRMIIYAACMVCESKLFINICISGSLLPINYECKVHGLVCRESESLEMALNVL